MHVLYVCQMHSLPCCSKHVSDTAKAWGVIAFTMLPKSCTLAGASVTINWLQPCCS